MSASTAFAQNARSLRGTVADNTGAVLLGANVVLTSESTKFAREGVTDARSGFFFATDGRANADRIPTRWELAIRPSPEEVRITDQRPGPQQRESATQWLRPGGTSRS